LSGTSFYVYSTLMKFVH